MKTVQLKIFLSLTLLSAMMATPALAQTKRGDRVRNGADYVEPLFIKAQKDATAILSSMSLNKLDSMPIDTSYKNWLQAPDRLAKLQYYTKNMELKFQEGPCNEGGAPRGSSFFRTQLGEPIMCVSYSYNRNTTPEQAIAMVIHEGGHFAGEEDHIFLSSFGVQLASKKPEELGGACRIQIDAYQGRNKFDITSVYGIYIGGSKEAIFRTDNAFEDDLKKVIAKANELKNSGLCDSVSFNK